MPKKQQHGKVVRQKQSATKPDAPNREINPEIRSTPNRSMIMQPSNDHMEHIEKATQGMMKACEDANGMAREHLDAATKAASVVSKGLQEIAQNVTNLVQDSVARGIDASKVIMSAKSVPEALNSHSEFMKDCFDQWVSCAGKMSEVAARMTQDAMSPLAEQTNTTISKFTQKMKEAA